MASYRLKQSVMNGIVTLLECTVEREYVCMRECVNVRSWNGNRTTKGENRRKEGKGFKGEKLA